jgi:hypothetical protein
MVMGWGMGTMAMSCLSYFVDVVGVVEVAEGVVARKRD